MKIPCEIVVWYVLPTIRKDIARELVEKHKMSQTEVAKRFGVTGAAISQYLKRKRGENVVLQEGPDNAQYMEAITASAARIAAGATEFADEVCGMCKLVKRVGILAQIYREQTGIEAPTCACRADMTQLVP
jgi:predicted transcriptional regulator